MTKKTFFKERTVEQIQNMNCSEVYRARGLVDRVMSIDAGRDALRLRFRVTPTRFGTRNTSRASRKNLRHGHYLEIDQPYSVDKALRTTEIPLQLRQRTLAKLTRIDEDENVCLGYSYRPTFDSKDKTRIYIPFWSIMDGCLRDTYDGQVCNNLRHLNAGAEIEFDKGGVKAATEGLAVVVKVPSSTQGQGRYRIKFIHVPISDNEHKRVTCWKTRPAYSSDNSAHKTFNIRYLEADYIDDSDFHMIYPQDVHGYHMIVRHFMQQHNLVPFERSQIAMPSKTAAEFWSKLCNNVLIWDPTINSDKGSYRHLHIDEKSVLQARQVGVLGPEETMYWDAERDGRIRDYKWGHKSKS